MIKATTKQLVQISSVKKKTHLNTEITKKKIPTYFSAMCKLCTKDVQKLLMIFAPFLSIVFITIQIVWLFGASKIISVICYSSAKFWKCEKSALIDGIYSVWYHFR